ncbi:MFS transporter [Microbacterium sp. cx-55]|uniref:MFS transporter n=1 Tax=Microbacterium sp. cx-55 TaxID=2875948 RepID=UPI001CC12358|nr:MFS transporter [Microbacterium sp. cx-55]MBZ4488439.1 MFS transporter [Microbacterium sp. cx-55]UGB35087.1 MFS transporter [Microbacterium sp. cx-55]
MDPESRSSAASATPPVPPPTANTGAIGPMGELFQDADSDRVVPRTQVISWAFWDWATQPFNSVILTFVFASLYIVSDSFLPADIAALPDTDAVKERAIADLASGYGLATTLAGILILLLAPVLGQSADRAGRKKRWLGVFTVLLALLQFALFFTLADPAYFWYGAIVLAVGAVVSEIAGVNYNAMLVQVSTPRTIGRVSGLGWGLGYIGGILALTLVVVLTFADWFGMDTSNGLAYRLIAVGCGIWTLVFAIPLFKNVPEAPPIPGAQKVGFFAGYVVLVKDVARLYRTHRPTFWFLFASAIYRDGLAGVFAFGGVLAAAGFGFSDTEVMIFGIAANIVAGISTIIAGRFDDLFGARAVIIGALLGLVVMAVVLFALHDLGPVIFWIGGLALSVCVGPAQASSRSLLARVTPNGMQGEIFGLYATTGRVASFLAPAAWTLSIALFGAIIYGVLGLGLVLLVGLIILLFVKLPPHTRLR